MMNDHTLYARGGIITERNVDFATVRLRVPAGVLTAAQIKQLAKISEKYGDGSLHLTMRQTVEIPHVKPDTLQKIAKDLEKNGTPIGAEHNEVVNIMACPGTERCKYANCETIDLARKIDEKVFGKELPIRVRIAVSGCTHMCNSPLLNDIGIIGRIRPLRTPGLCTGCGTCVEYCRECAISIKNGISLPSPEVRVCPLPDNGRRPARRLTPRRGRTHHRRDRGRGRRSGRPHHLLDLSHRLERPAPCRPDGRDRVR